LEQKLANEKERFERLEENYKELREEKDERQAEFSGRLEEKRKELDKACS
jgi:hypothetical protein